MSQLPELVHMDGFVVSGLHVRTANHEERNPITARIPALWQQLHSQWIAELGFAPDTVFGVYSNYESDATGAYSVTAGIKVPSCSGKDQATVRVQTGSYLLFKGKGSMPQTVITIWNRVWDYFTEHREPRRCFATDFECYHGREEVAVYIGVDC